MSMPPSVSRKGRSRSRGSMATEGKPRSPSVFSGSVAWLRGDLQLRRCCRRSPSSRRARPATRGNCCWGAVTSRSSWGLTGDYPRAIALEREVVARARERQDITVLLPVLSNLGYHLFLSGETEDARRTLEEAVALQRAHLSVPLLANGLAMLGALERVARPALALEYHREALMLLRDSEVPRESAAALDGVAATLLVRGDPDSAARLLGAADATRKRTSTAGLELWEGEDVTATIAETRAALGEDAFAAAWAEGSALGLSQAIDLALAVLA